MINRYYRKYWYFFERKNAHICFHFRSKTVLCFLDLDMIHKMIYNYDYHKLEGNNHFYLWTSIYHTHLKRSSHMWHLAYVKWINWMKKVIVIVFIDLKSSFTKGKSIPPFGDSFLHWLPREIYCFFHEPFKLPHTWFDQILINIYYCTDLCYKTSLDNIYLYEYGYGGFKLFHTLE